MGRNIDDGPDDRQDPGTRDRVTEIAAGLESWRQKTDDRIALAAKWFIFGAVAFAVCFTITYAIIQGSRWSASRDNCLSKNQTAQATVSLLRDLDVPERVVQLAQLRYPHTPPLAHLEGREIVVGPSRSYDGPMTCHESADRAVGGFKL